MEEKKKRKPKEKKNEFLQVYFSAEQKTIVQDYCDKIDVPFSTFVRQLLQKEGVFDKKPGDAH